MAEDKTYERITINHIFLDNRNWEVYEFKHRSELRDVEVKEVRKMLECGKKTGMNDFFLFIRHSKP
ncbi:MAG: hypothetical protein APU95_05395 [Hadesarchaea archaeon YNP_N21]|nr:MAG: hypothetical protein APU95_05395 [Hadesarchaea archaeon YNP_N21]